MLYCQNLQKRSPNKIQTGEGGVGWSWIRLCNFFISKYIYDIQATLVLYEQITNACSDEKEKQNTSITWIRVCVCVYIVYRTKYDMTSGTKGKSVTTEIPGTHCVVHLYILCDILIPCLLASDKFCFYREDKPYKMFSHIAKSKGKTWYTVHLISFESFTILILILDNNSCP